MTSTTIPAAGGLLERWAEKLLAASWTEQPAAGPIGQPAKKLTDPRRRVSAKAENDTDDPECTLSDLYPAVESGDSPAWRAHGVGPLTLADLTAAADAADSPAGPDPDAVAALLEQSGDWYLEHQEYDEDKQLVERRWSTYDKERTVTYTPDSEWSTHGWSVRRPSPAGQRPQTISLTPAAPAAVIAALALAEVAATT